MSIHYRFKSNIDFTTIPVPGRTMRLLDLKYAIVEINKLEKTEIEEFKYYNYEEKYRSLIVLALALIVFEWILRSTVFKSFI